nr:MAG TPA: hypothetical protein [Caudoviricetes sp.]
MTACLCTWLFLLKLCQRWVNYYVVLSIAIQYVKDRRGEGLALGVHRGGVLDIPVYRRSPESVFYT